MDPLLRLVLYTAMLTWLTLLGAALIRAQAWTPRGLQLSFGNRDDLDPPTPLAGRAARTAVNTLENLVLFTAVALVAHATVPGSERVLLGARIFFYSRILYVPLYVGGVKYVRSLTWTISIAGLAMMIAEALG